MSENNLTVFQFESQAVRVFTDEAGEPWWVAKDVCSVLELSNPTEVLRGLDEDEKSTLRISEGTSPNGGNPNVNIISESGLYTLIMRSNKPQAKAFRKWVTSEVLPSLRKTGQYQIPNQVKDALNPNVRSIKDVDTVFRASLRMARAWGLTGNQALLAADKLTRRVCGGHGPSTLLEAPYIVNEAQERNIRPSDAGIMIGGMSANAFNKTLEVLGYQSAMRDSKGRLIWAPTEKGRPYAVLVDTGKKHGDGTPVQQLLWRESIIGVVQNAMTIESATQGNA